LLGSRVEVARGKTAAVALPLAAAVKATEYERKPHLPGIRNTAETGAIKRRVIMGAVVQIKPALRIIQGDRIATSASLSGLWLFCPAWEFIPNGRLPSRCPIRVTTVVDTSCCFALARGSMERASP
jgi:hypothetical protein